MMAFGRGHWVSLAVIVLSLGWIGLLAVPHLESRKSLLDPIEATLTDLRLYLAGTGRPASELIIVAIDDETLTSFGGSYPLAREDLALIVRAIADAGARTLAIDILLTEIRSPTDDAALADALNLVPTVIAAAGNFPAYAAATKIPVTQSELWPTPVFAANAQIGLVNLVTDTTGTPRHTPLLFETTRGIQPAMALRAVADFLNVEPRFTADSIDFAGRTVPLDTGLHLPLRILGPQATVPTMSAIELLRKGARASDSLEGRLVLLGFTASATGDRFETPFEPNMPGVEVVAAAISQLLGGPHLQRTALVRTIDVMMATVLAIGAVTVALLVRLTVAVPLAVFAVLGWLVATALFYAQGIWFAAALPIMAALPPLAVAVSLRHIRERRQAKQLGRATRALKLFHSPLLAERLASDPDYLREPEPHETTVLFIDMTGFTALSRKLGPANTRDMLKVFQSGVGEAIGARNGVVLNFMGDGAMAAFGLGQDGPGADDALLSAFAMATDLKPMLHAKTGVEEVSVRIGLHAGPVVLSRLGHEHHQQVTISGDTVNLASRLLEIAKVEDATVVATSAVLEALQRTPACGPDRQTSVEIRGIDDPVSVGLWKAARFGRSVRDGTALADRTHEDRRKPQI